MSKLIEPKDLFPAAAGVAIGLGILVFFVLLAQTMGLQLVIDHSALPRQ